MARLAVSANMSWGPCGNFVESSRRLFGSWGWTFWPKVTTTSRGESATEVWASLALSGLPGADIQGSLQGWQRAPTQSKHLHRVRGKAPVDKKKTVKSAAWPFSGRRHTSEPQEAAALRAWYLLSWNADHISHRNRFPKY